MTTNGAFIAGTDTGVGKTVVMAGLLALLRARGIDAVPMKPVATGCGGRGGQARADDLEFALRACGMPLPGRADYRLMCPYRFASPCSPHLAARRAGRRISADRILECFQALRARHDWVLVEGAGGLLAPLNDKTMMIDLAARLGLPVLLVCRPGLGTINHTLLSLQALRQAGLRALGVVFNDTEPSSGGYIEKDNRKTIARLGRTAVLGQLPFVGGLEAMTEEARERFRRTCARRLSAACALMRAQAAGRQEKQRSRGGAEFAE